MLKLNLLNSNALRFGPFHLISAAKQFKLWKTNCLKYNFIKFVLIFMISNDPSIITVLKTNEKCEKYYFV